MTQENAQQQKFDVHYYVTARVKVPGIVAGSHEEAAKVGEGMVSFHDALRRVHPTDHVEHVEFDESKIGAILIDKLDDDGEFIESESVWIDGDYAPLVDGLTKEELLARNAKRAMTYYQQLSEVDYIQDPDIVSALFAYQQYIISGDTNPFDFKGDEYVTDVVTSLPGFANGFVTYETAQASAKP